MVESRTGSNVENLVQVRVTWIFTHVVMFFDMNLNIRSKKIACDQVDLLLEHEQRKPQTYDRRSYEGKHT